LRGYYGCAINRSTHVTASLRSANERHDVTTMGLTRGRVALLLVPRPLPLLVRAQHFRLGYAAAVVRLRISRSLE
jgi:hypothetical protein